MLSKDHSERARQLFNAALARSSSRSSVRPAETPPATPRPSKRHMIIKIDDDEVDEPIEGVEVKEPFLSTDSPSLPVELLALDPKNGEAMLPALDNEQKQAVQLILNGHNTFVTGSAGTGKSTVIRWAVMLLRHAGRVVYITAPTGQAAQNVGGTTYHNYMGWGPEVKKEGIKAIMKRAEFGPVQERIEKTDVLVIDEISMVDNHTLDRLNRAMQHARGQEEEIEPFGGVQIILSGDFLQLPPVKPFEVCFSCGRDYTNINRITVASRKTKVRTYECNICDHQAELETDKWAFCSQVWESAKLKNVHLTQNHRQSEEHYMKLLANIRAGREVTEADKAIFSKRNAYAQNGIHVYPRLQEVRAKNDQEFSKLHTREVSYKCYDHFQLNPLHPQLEHRKMRSVDGTLVFLNGHHYDAKLSLKEGMPVVLLTNLDVEGGLVNGSQGRIVRFDPYSEAALSNAAGIQHTDAGPNSAGGAAPRPFVNRRCNGDNAFLRVEQVKCFILQKDNQHKVWPVVQFNNGKEVTIFANCSMSMLGDEKPYSLEMRTQIPLQPGWAITVHKSQGMSFDKVVVNIENSFDGRGMAYVALSRARTLGGLLVKSLGTSLDTRNANPEVIDFYERMKCTVGRFQ